jgi:hypothetical protein
MRKNINKLIAFAIGISVISGSSISVFAAENAKDNSTNVNTSVTATTNSANNTTTTNNNTTNSNSTGVIYVQNQVKQKPVLTLKSAIDAAISNSDKLALKSKEIKLYEDKLDLQDELDDNFLMTNLN